ncbi:MAG: FtsX-like permease family protein, partial [Acidobacteria bacterium]|nr:FtsX-like permease family protein [Acidobacteriota bacterium]
VGKQVRIGEFQVTVVGVFKERAATFGQSEIKRETVLIPFPVMRYFVETEFIRTLYAQAASPESVPALTRQVEDVLSSRHRPGAVYRVQNMQGVLQAASNISMALTVVLMAVALIALLISGIGIMNIMLVTVTQRTREIGIRKAIGAPRREILMQFLLEAFLISSAGAVAGILIAVSIPILIQPFLPGNLRVPISWVSVAVAFVVTSMAGVLFGYLPAQRAAQMQPTESLRHE